MRRRWRCKTGSRRSASWSQTRRAAWSTETAAACTTRPGASAAATTASAGSPAGSSSAAGSAGRCCSPAVSPSCSSSTRRRRSPRGIAPARSAAAKTTTASEQIWRELHPGQVGADAIDAQLHTERVAPRARTQLRHEARLDELPDGAFVLQDGAPWLVLGSHLLSWTTVGYVTPRPRPVGQQVLLVTPPSLVSVLRAGWQPLVPLLHPSALAITA